MSDSGGRSTHTPPLPENGEGYEEWKKMIAMWSKFTKYEKKQRAPVVTVNAFRKERHDQLHYQWKTLFSMLMMD